LRRLAKTVEREARRMPIHIDILENEVLGPVFLKGLQEGLQEGRQEGLQKGLQEGLQTGERTVLRRLIEKRFGALPSWAGEKLEVLSTSELEDLSERVLDARNVDELLK
jgi:flagellar biosynthesis/type III secretory pathway protein FliH